MTDTTHNGWTNYATWRVNLEMIDGWTDYHMDGDEFEKFEEVYQLADHLKDYAEEQIENYCDSSKGVNLARDYALAFMQEVNWQEIAQYIANDYPQIMTTRS